MTSTASTSTREDLLDAAERLFALHGVNGTSLRAVTREAGANVASVHYHFGSKESLLREVFARRLGPVNRRRFELLEACGDQPPGGRIEAILEAFVRPVLEMRWGQGADEGSQSFARLVARVFSDPVEELQMLLAEELGEAFRRFTEALAAEADHLDRAEVEERFLFSAGAMAHLVLGRRMFTRLAGRDPDERPDLDALCRELCTFLAAGFRAPAAEEA